jgi:hypothetical protein
MEYLNAASYAPDAIETPPQHTFSLDEAKTAFADSKSTALARRLLSGTKTSSR